MPCPPSTARPENRDTFCINCWQSPPPSPRPAPRRPHAFPRYNPHWRSHHRLPANSLTPSLRHVTITMMDPLPNLRSGSCLELSIQTSELNLHTSVGGSTASDFWHRPCAQRHKEAPRLPFHVTSAGNLRLLLGCSSVVLALRRRMPWRLSRGILGRLDNWYQFS